MMRKFLILFLLILLPAGQALAVPHREISKFELVSESIDPNTLVLIDIDTTLVKPKTDFGGHAYYDSLVTKFTQEEGLTLPQAKMKAYDHWASIQKDVEYEVIDKGVYDFITKAKASGAVVFAFTGRSPKYSDITNPLLHKHNLKMTQLTSLNFNKVYDLEMGPSQYEPIPAGFERGILYSHELNGKGKVFKDFLPLLQDYRAKHRMPEITKIIFIDDKLYNLESVHDHITDLNVTLISYLFAGGNE